MVFENGVKNIQAAAYNGARAVPISKIIGSITYETIFCIYGFQLCT